jgi:putative transposase
MGQCPTLAPSGPVRAESSSSVNPAFTSQDCSQCGHRQKMPLAEREYRCPCCGLILGRDHNAALNVLNLGLGLQTVGIKPLEAAGL